MCRERASDGGRSNDFLDRLDGGAGLNASEAAQVSVDRQLAFGGQAEHVNHFQPGRAGSVLNAHADAEGPGIKFRAQALLNLLDLFGGGGLVGRWSALGQNGSVRQRRAKNQGAGSGVTGSGAVVDE